MKTAILKAKLISEKNRSISLLKELKKALTIPTHQDIYLEAAKIVSERESGPWCAIELAKYGFLPMDGTQIKESNETKTFEKLFSPGYDIDTKNLWEREFGENWKECLILALCFASAMVKCGDA